MALANQESSPDFCVRVVVIARKRGTGQVDFEPIAWAHLSAENASWSHGHHERVHAGSITCEHANPERLDHGDSRFFLVSFSNVQARDASVCTGGAIQGADINQILESKQHD